MGKHWQLKVRKPCKATGNSDRPQQLTSQAAYALQARCFGGVRALGLRNPGCWVLGLGFSFGLGFCSVLFPFRGFQGLVLGLGVFLCVCVCFEIPTEGFRVISPPGLERFKGAMGLYKGFGFRVLGFLGFCRV